MLISVKQRVLIWFYPTFNSKLFYAATFVIDFRVCFTPKTQFYGKEPKTHRYHAQNASYWIRIVL